MDLVVADLMKQNRWPTFATPQPWHEVMQALWRVFWDRTRAQRTNWVAIVVQ